MRSRVPIRSRVAGLAAIEIEADGRRVVSIEPTGRSDRKKARAACVHEFAPDAELAVGGGHKVKRGQRLIRIDERAPTEIEETNWWRPGSGRGSFGGQFRSRVRPSALLREMSSRLNESARSLNVSDGGHIENLATIELLRRRCRYIVVGDAEMDSDHEFGGLTILLRTARVELGITIDIELDALRPDERGLTERHWSVGRINYPDQDEAGVLLYIKSSITGAEDTDILGYRAKHPAFPHESTADQFFDEGQFESYRRLGYRMAEDALRVDARMARHLDVAGEQGSRASFDEVRAWFAALLGSTDDASSAGAGDPADDEEPRQHA